MNYEYLDRSGAQWLIRKIKNGLSGKVDKVPGKGLSTYDLTEELKKSYDGAVEAVEALKNGQPGTGETTAKSPAVHWNLLDNSNFVNPVAQAGVGGSHGTENYAVDRWILASGNVELVNGIGLKLTGTMKQKLSFVPDEVTPFVGVVDGTADITYSEKVVTIKSMGGIIRWAALYEGTMTEAPVYAAKGYGAELAECLRYYQRHTSLGDAINKYTLFGIGTTSSATSCPFLVPMRGQMRTMPTFAYGGGFYLKNNAGSKYVCTELTMENESIGTAYASVIARCGGSTLNGVYSLVGGDSNATYLEFCADL